MLCGDIADQLLDEHGLTDSRTSEKTDLTALCIRRQKVNDLDPRLQDLHHRALVFKCRRLSVDDPFLRIIDGRTVIDRLSQHIEQPAQRLLADRHLDPRPGGSHFHILVESLARREHQTAHLIIPEMLGDLHNALLSVVFNLQRILDKGKVAVLKYYVNNRSHDLNDSSFIHNHNCSHFLRKGV